MNLINLQMISDQLTDLIINWKFSHDKNFTFTDDNLKEIITDDISSELDKYIDYLKEINFQNKLKAMLGDLYFRLDDEEDDISLNVFFIPGDRVFQEDYPDYYFVDVLINICNKKFEIGLCKTKEYPFCLYPHYSTVEICDEDEYKDVLHLAEIGNIILNNPEIDDIDSLRLLIELK